MILPGAAYANSESRERAIALSVLKRMLWLLPAIAALCVILFLAFGSARISETIAKFLDALLFSFFIGLPSAFTVTWIYVRYEERSSRLAFAWSAVSLVLAATFGTAASILCLIWAGVIPAGRFAVAFRQNYPMSLVITLVVGLCIIVFEIMRSKLRQAAADLRNRELEQERANKLLAEARLSSLESRIHPHFLFNTLNSIAALIPTDPRRAEDTVGKLASLLRFSLNANQGGLVPLAQEIKVVRDYLEIEATRFGPRLRYSIDISAEFDNIKTPPLAVQTLVENAVKHVVSNRAQGASIRVAASRVNDVLRIEVADDGPGFALDAIASGHGLDNLIARLDLLFGEAGRLEARHDSVENVVSLTYPA